METKRVHLYCCVPQVFDSGDCEVKLRSFRSFEISSVVQLNGCTTFNLGCTATIGTNQMRLNTLASIYLN